MATPTLRPPVDSEIFIKEGRNSRPWLNFFRQLARLFQGLLSNSAVTTPNVTPAADVTANPVTSPDGTAAGVGYLQATAATWVTLINETKADVNTLSLQINTINAQLSATIALVNELKAKHNSIITSLNQ